MIPRYQPDLNLAAWIRWLSTRTGDTRAAQADFIQTLNPGQNLQHALIFAQARQGLYAYFRYLKQTIGGGTVLISAQICPIVPYLVREAGFSVRFVDSDVVYPSPSATQYQQAIDQDMVAIIIAPLYGHLQSGWEPLLQNLGQIKLVLDLAQGLMLDPRLDPAFYQKATAIVYSFSLGKGLDTGGALLLTATPLDLIEHRHQQEFYYLGILFQAIILRFLIRSGLYVYFLNRVEAEVETAKVFEPKQSAQYLAPTNIYLLWEAKLRTFVTDVKRARQRADRLSKMPPIRQACHDLTFFKPEATHLRQIIRFRDPELRDRILDTLPRYGVDSAPLGCMSETTFKQFQQQKLEVALVQHLS